MTARQLLGVGMIWLTVALVGAFMISWAVVEWWVLDGQKTITQCDRASEAYYRAVADSKPSSVLDYLRDEVIHQC